MIVEQWVWTRAPETAPGPLHSRQPQGHSVWVIQGGERSERGKNSQGARRKSSRVLAQKPRSIQEKREVR